MLPNFSFHNMDSSLLYDVSIRALIIVSVRTKRIDSQDKIKMRKAVDNQIGTVKIGFYG